MEVRDFAMELRKLKGGMKKVKENGIGCVRVERACGEDEVLRLLLPLSSRRICQHG